MVAARSMARDLILTKKAQLLGSQEVGGAADGQDPIVAAEAAKICAEQYGKGQAAVHEAMEAAERANGFAQDAEQAHKEILESSEQASTCAETKQRAETSGRGSSLRI